MLGFSWPLVFSSAFQDRFKLYTNFVLEKKYAYDINPLKLLFHLIKVGFVAGLNQMDW